MTETAQDLIARLNRTLTTMMNDDLTFDLTEKRTRHIERTVAVQEAAEWITAALAREAGLRKTLEWVQHNGNFANRDNIMSVVNNALEVKP